MGELELEDLLRKVMPEGVTREDSRSLRVALAEIATITRTVAQNQQGRSLELLALLRVLEALHREIRDSFFQEALPDNRQALYALLRDIELSGGWPYIHRLKLQALLVNLLSEAEFAELTTGSGPVSATLVSATAELVTPPETPEILEIPDPAAPESDGSVNPAHGLPNGGI
jgi:hypothetical protein